VRSELLALLACPACRADLVAEVAEADGEELVAGTLTCRGCGAAFPIVRGVPRLTHDAEALAAVAASFGYEWKAHHAGAFERDTLFGRTAQEDWRYYLDGLGIDDGQVSGAVALDAGCGSGRLTRQVGEHGAALVVGMDLNDAVDEAYALCRDAPNVAIVQGNVLAPPFKPGTFDLVWSNGVIHHTPDAAGCHRALSRCVRPGGRLYVWVYPRRFNPFRLVKDVFDALRITRLPAGALLVVARAIAYPSWLALQLYRAARALPPLRPRGAWARRTVRPRRIDELRLTWFDALSPAYDSRHSEDEVVGWFAAQGFTAIEAIEEPKVGVPGVAPPA
jgi:SAM-dependent methyltransferase